jgi:hypothetical protein
MGRQAKGRRTGAKRRKRCAECRALFEPDARTKGGQKYCSKQGCQKRRQRNNEKDWRRRHREQQRIWVRLWNKRHSEYSRQRREKNPQLFLSNRHQTKARMQKIRARRRFDQSKVILRQLAVTKEDKYYLARGGWMILRLTKARSFTRGRLMMDNHRRMKRVANRVPRGRLYDLSEEIHNQPGTDP